MDSTEKAAALKKIALEFAPNAESPEARLLAAVIDLVDALALQVAGLEEELDELSEQVDDMEEELDELNSLLLEDDEEGDGTFELECPNCGIAIQVDEGTLEEGSITCPGCEELLEFEFGCDCEECADGCECDHDHEAE
jgi:hypothetical protein